MADLIWGLYLASCAFSAGLLLARPLGLGGRGALETGVWGGALGLGLLGYGVLALGSVPEALGLGPGALHGTAVAALAAGLLVLGWSSLGAWLLAAWRARLGIERPRGFLEHSLVALVALLIGWHLLACWMPTLNPDALAYHLAMPKRYLAEGAIQVHYDVYQALFPELQEMLFTAGFAGGGEPAAYLFSFLFQLLLAGAVFVFVRKDAGGSRAEALLAILLLQGFVGVLLSVGPDKVEPATALFALLGLSAWLRWRGSGGTGPLVACGIAAGLTAAFKYYGLPIMAVLGLAVLGTGLRRQGFAGLRAAAVYSLAAVAACAVWYLRNYLLTGNPVWPQFAAQFPSAWWDQPAAGAFWAQEHARRATGFDSGWWELLVLPWYATMGVRGGAVTRLSPLLLAFAPLLLLFRRIPFALKAGLAQAWCFGVFWFFQGNPQVRYLFPALPACAAAGAHAVARLRGSLAARLAIVLIAFVTVWAVAQMSWYRRSDLAVAIGLRDRTATLVRRSGLVAACDWANRHLPRSGVKVLLVHVSGGYYLDRPYLYADPGKQFLVHWQRLESSKELRARLLDLGITHVLLGDWPEDKLLPVQQRVLELLLPVVETQGRELYRDRARERAGGAIIWALEPQGD